jgi:hypothetical protein
MHSAHLRPRFRPCRRQMAFAFCTFLRRVASPQAYQILHFAFTAAPIIATPRDFGLSLGALALDRAKT